MEENEDGLDVWRDLVLSPKGLFSGFAPEPCVMKSMEGGFHGGDGISGVNCEMKVEDSMFEERRLEGCEQGHVSVVGGYHEGIKNGGSIAERRAAKFGFNAPKISTPRFRSSSPLPSPGARSPYLTVPAGISPTALLDSPMFLPNSQPSPTTGTFMSPTLYGNSQMLVSASPANADKGSDGGYSSMSNPNTNSISLAYPHAVEKQVSSTGGLGQSFDAHADYHSLTAVLPPEEFEFPVQFPRDVDVNNHDAGSPLDRKFSDGLTADANSSTLQPSRSDAAVCFQMQDRNESSLEEDLGTCNSIEGDHKGTYTLTGTVRTSEDGYNWRKYGQKQVKGCEYPRSYYKCTHPNCQVKKKVERSHDGQITEIIYKGAHNHPEPQPCRKMAFGSSLPFGETSKMGDGCGYGVKAEDGSVWRNIQPGCKDVKIGSHWRPDGLERTSSTSGVTDVSDPLSNTLGKSFGLLDTVGTPELSSTLASHDDNDEEGTTTQGRHSVADDNDNEPDSKRRKKEECFIEATLSSRAVREPRVVVQIETEIDILDDGYRWRKYGQKVVKGNPNPRSYYKCTSAGCTVRKHVERASHDLKYVIITYEGKHSHLVPAARNSSHANSGGGSLPPATNSQSALTFSRNPHLSKPEPHLQDFDRKLECNNDFFRQNFLGSLGGAIPPFHPMKFPSLPNAGTYGTFGMTNHHAAYPGGMVPAIPDLSIPLTLGFPHSSNFTVPNYSNPGRPPSSVQTLFTGSQPEESNFKLLRPKQEREDDSFYAPGMPNIDHTSSSSSSSIYSHMVGSYPS